MCASSNYHLDIELAKDVFKTQNPAMVIYLKDFFTILPSPKCVERVLTLAFYQLADADPDACRWILRNYRYLMPELDLVDMARQFVITKLQNRGFLQGKDFYFAVKSGLQVNDLAKFELMTEISHGDRLLLEEILQFGDRYLA